MNDPPFGLRDYLAYGMTGLTLIVAVALTVHGGVDLRPELSATDVVLLLVGCYLLGHVVAEVTAPLVVAVLERRVGAPLQMLLNGRGGGGWLRRRYTGPLSASTRKNVIEAAMACGMTFESDDTISRGERAGLQSLATAVVREVHETPDRVNRYGLLEDFCRNVSAAASIGVLVLLVGGFLHQNGGLMVAALVALATAVVMGARYLHFRRLYWAVVLAAFAAHCLGHGAVHRSE